MDMELFRGAHRRTEEGHSGPVRPAWHRHRLPGSPGRAADQADRRSDRAPEGAQARPPLASRAPAAGRPAAPAAQIRRPGRCGALPLPDRPARPASLTPEPGYSAPYLLQGTMAFVRQPFWLERLGAVFADPRAPFPCVISDAAGSQMCLIE